MDHEALKTLRMDRDEAAAGARRRARPWLVAGGMVAVFLVGALAWLLLRSEAIMVETAAARAETGPGAGAAGTTVLNASGYVVARRVATIASRITGQISEVLIEEGQSVAAGDVLARLDDAPARVDLALVEGRLDTARRNEAEVRVRHEEAQRTLARTRSLREESLVSQAQLDAAEADVAALAARLAVVQSEARTAGNALAVARRNIEDTVIRAPFAGVVVSKNAQPGETISPISAGGGFTRTGIATIVDMDSLEVEVDVNEAFINRVRTGQRVDAVLDAYPDWRIPSSVIGIVPTADRQKATVRVRIAFDALDARILPEMGVQVWFMEPALERADNAPVVGAVWVPQAALRSEGGNHIFVVRDGRAERRAVRVGQRRSSEIEVTAGVSAGDLVVVSAVGELADGAPVTAERR